MGPFLAAALRALAVTLLLSTVLLPAADHHALARLVGVVEGDGHWAQAHHHRAQSVRESIVERMTAAERAEPAIPFEGLPGPPVLAPGAITMSWASGPPERLLGRIVVAAALLAPGWPAGMPELDLAGVEESGRAASPVLIAAGAPVDALGFATLAVDGAILAFMVAMLVARISVALDRRPFAPWRRVPVPPPRVSLLVTA